MYGPHVPFPKRGAARDRHGRWERDAMDADNFTRRVSLPRTVKARGPDLPTLGSSFAGDLARRRGLKSPVPRGERADRPLTPIARGRPDCFGGPVVTNACAFYLCTRGYGCAKHPAFPAPSLFSGRCFRTARAKSCRGNTKVCPRRLCSSQRRTFVAVEAPFCRLTPFPPVSKPIMVTDRSGPGHDGSFMKIKGLSGA